MSGADSPDQGPRTSSLGDDENSHRQSRRQEKIRGREEALALWDEPVLTNGPCGIFCHEYLQNGGAFGHSDKAWNALTPSEQAPYHAKSANEIAKYTADLDAYNERIPLSPSVHSTDRDDSGLSDDEFEIEGYNQYIEACRRRDVQQWNRYRRDHPRACGGALLPIPAQPFRLDLPLELRWKIYAMVLGNEKALTQMDANGSADDEEGPFDVRIFSVCRQVFAEAVDVFYRINILNVSVSHDVDLPLFISAPTGRKAPRPTTHLRRVNLWISYSRPETKRWIESVLRRVCEVLSKCERLIEIRISAICQQSWVNDSMHRNFDRMLELVSVIKEVDRVIFTDKDTLWTQYMITESVPLGTPEQAARIKKIMESKPT